MDFDDGGDSQKEGDEGVGSVAGEEQVVALEFKFEDGDEVDEALDGVSHQVWQVLVSGDGLVSDGCKFQVGQVVDLAIEVGQFGIGEALAEDTG